MLGDLATPESRRLLTAQLGLDRPLLAQLLGFVSGLLHADLGVSIARHRSVTALISERVPYTLLLAATASLFANLVGISLGVLAAHRPSGTLARATFAASIVLLAIPVFWLGPLLVIAFSLRWPWLPVSSFRDLSGLVLPALTMGLGLSASVFQTTRASVLECLGADFIRTAHAKGAGSLRVLFRHALPVAGIPILTVSALQFTHLLAGAVLTETIFDWPGIGKLMFDAILMRDYPLVQGSVLLIALIYVAMSMLTDVVNDRLNPRSNDAGRQT